MPDDLVKVRCPIHGFVALRRQSELPVLNHPAMQRLRRIRQLAMAYLAFPGAMHTRFDHSLGVLHVADCMAQAVGIEGDVLSNIRLAGLVHDVGHGPFSHVSEYAFHQLSGGAGETEELHEAVTREILRHELRGEVLSGQQADAVQALLSPKEYGRAVERDIISGPLDADKLDYLLRDSYFCGVRYGVYDLPRLLDTMTVVRDPGALSYLGVREEDLAAVDQYVLARYNLGQVYFHKVRRIADAMLVRAIVLAVHEGHPEIKQLFTPKRMTASYMRAYLRADDEGLVRSILEGPRRPSADLMGRLWRRDLVKQVVSAPLSRCSDAAFKQKITQLGFRQELEQEIANICSKRQPWLVFVDYQAGRPVRKGAGQEGPEVIPVVGTDRVTRNYDSLSPVFRQGAPRGEEHLRIYAPVQGDSDDTRKRIRSELERNIAALVGLEGPVPPTPGPGA